MKTTQNGTEVKIWLTAEETSAWATKPGNQWWPCSTLAGHKLFACFKDGDLVEIEVGDGEDLEINGPEFNAMIEDFFGSVNPVSV